MRLSPKLLLLSVLTVLAAAALAYSLSGHAPPAPPAKPPALISVVSAQRQDLPLALSAQGRLVALNQVEVRPQVTATIAAIHFKEGDDVQAGQLLFTLDSADARSRLQHAEGQSAQIAAQLADAKREHRRSLELVKSNFISASTVDTAASKADALQAQLKAAQADIDSARVALRYTSIVAPIAARTGAVLVHPGSLAQVGAAAPLVTLAQFSPIGVEFSLPEQDLAAVVRARTQGPVPVQIDGEDGVTVSGTLSFINNVVNADTGTIALKAALPNDRKTLWPGAYARVTVLAGTDRNAVVLPPQAVLEGPDGRFVYLAGSDGKAARQPVTLVRIQGGQAVVAGLAAGTRVVLEGGTNLRPGDAFTVTAPAPAPAPASASASASAAPAPANTARSQP